MDRYSSCKMKDNALSMANYFIELAQKDGHEIRPLRLMKLVYIAHGFMLAMLDRSVLNPRFDRVEAWKYGPVIPSVYHSFKHYGNNPVREKVGIITEEHADGTVVTETPIVTDKDIMGVLDFVWNRYKDKPTPYLITLLHREDTPWAYCYRVGKNVEIPEEMTKVYYNAIVNRK